MIKVDLGEQIYYKHEITLPDDLPDITVRPVFVKAKIQSTVDKSSSIDALYKTNTMSYSKFVAST